MDYDLIRLKDDINDKIKETDIKNSVNIHYLSMTFDHLVIIHTSIVNRYHMCSEQKCKDELYPYLKDINDTLHLINARMDYLKEYLPDVKNRIKHETNLIFLKKLYQSFDYKKAEFYYNNNYSSAEMDDVNAIINLIDERINFLNTNASGKRRKPITKGRKKKMLKKRKSVRK